MKHSLKGFNSRCEWVEKGISKFEDRLFKLSLSKERKEKRMMKNEQSRVQEGGEGRP